MCKYSMSLFGRESIFTNDKNVNTIQIAVILLSIIGFAITQQMNWLLVGIGTLIMIKMMSMSNVVDGFTNNVLKKEEKEDVDTRKKLIEKHFQPPSKKNPFGNVLLTDIVDNPDKKAASPSFDPAVKDDIQQKVKRQTQMLNPTITNTSKQLYGDLYDKFQLDTSLMRFYATPNTRVENNQNAFANYLYGNMPSGKEDTPEGAMMRVKDNWQWINP